MSSSLQTTKRPTKEVLATTVPTLPNGNDAEVASQLKLMIADAESGLKRIARLGSFIDHIRERLPHGKFNHWMAAHCSDVDRSTVFRWRRVCAHIVNDAGYNYGEILKLERPLYQILELPLGELTEKESEIVDRINGSAKTMKFKDVVKSVSRKRPELSPEAKVAAENKAHFNEWLDLVVSLERMLKGDSLGRAISFDPSVANRFEQVRLDWGEKLKVVTRAHKAAKK